ncbi:MAG: hypothetical protein WB677_25870 [Xanthobacteraceae bacterium]
MIGKLKDELVHIGPTELSVATRRLDFEDAFAELHDCDVERASTEIDDNNP